MSRFLRGAALAALTMAATTAVASAAQAQTYNRLVVFGDSLSDNGNLYLATGGAQPPSPPYYQGRFSTGPVFTELLGFNATNFMGPVTGSINYAFGGARTDAVQTAPLAMRLQLASYLSRGGTFGPNDLVSVLGGANNIFQGLPAAGASANPQGAIVPVTTAAAADINIMVNTIAGAGAGTILVTNLPKLSLTPQFRNTPAGALADFAAGNFNDQLRAGLFTTAAARPGTNIIMMDLFKVGDSIAANPGAFGITNVTQSCLNTSTGQLCNDPGYFYLDGVHPTARGHQVIATLANDYLYYGDTGAQSAVHGETAFRHREDSLDSATESFSGREAWEAGTAIKIGGSYDQTNTDSRGVVGEHESEGYGARMALESGTERLRFGVAGGYRHAAVEGGSQTFTVETMSLDVYAGFRSGNVFASVAGGLAADDFSNVERMTFVGPIMHIADYEGSSRGVRGQAGVWMDMGGLAISPRVAVTWAETELDGYAEQGAAAQLEFQERTVGGVFAEAALRAEGDMGDFGFFVEGGYRDSLDDSSEAVRVGIFGNPAQVLSRDVEDPWGGQFLASAGLTGDLGPFKMDVAYRGRFGDHADSHMGGVTLTLPLQ